MSFKLFILKGHNSESLGITAVVSLSGEIFDIFVLVLRSQHLFIKKQYIDKEHNE